MEAKTMVRCVCGGKLRSTSIERGGIKMAAQKCEKCGETYISGSEMLRYDILKGKSSMARKIRKSGDSLVVTVPRQIVEKFNVHTGDFIAFESKDDEIKLRILHAD